MYPATQKRVLTVLMEIWHSDRDRCLVLDAGDWPSLARRVAGWIGCCLASGPIPDIKLCTTRAIWDNIGHISVTAKGLTGSFEHGRRENNKSSEQREPRDPSVFETSPVSRGWCEHQFPHVQYL